MNKVIMVVLIAGVVSVLAGFVFLLTWDIPAPSEQVERVLPDDELPK
ncbi:MAG: hypothetical protein KAR62_00550 [Sphingomonadales bacterium]|nr:hypothetical protein [Sphingomonadales bacterium]